MSLAATNSDKPRIGLAMIVRNESAVIARALNSVKDFVDVWTIIDTGSTDNTVEIIRNELDGIPGALYEREWVNFGHNRNELLDLARETADFLILLDADIEVRHLESVDLRSLTCDSYDVHVTGGVEYFFPYIIKSNFGWRYVGATHEYLSAPPQTKATSARLESVEFHHHGDGGSKAEKYTRDLALLEAALLESPNDPRTLFYLAQTRQNLGDFTGALSAYRSRIEAGGWEEEIFWSMYQIAEIYRLLGDWSMALSGYLLAWDYRPHRIEPLVRASMGLRELGAHQTAFAVLDRAKSTMDPGGERLFVESWMYEWAFDFEWAINAWWVGHKEEARAIWNKLLERDDLPENYRTSVESNLTLS
jgi:tetratricopeptide (TPR) repeat protein